MACVMRNVLLFEASTEYLQKEGATIRPPNWRASWTLDLVAQMEKVLLLRPSFRFPSAFLPLCPFPCYTLSLLFPNMLGHLLCFPSVALTTDSDIRSGWTTHSSIARRAMPQSAGSSSLQTMVGQNLAAICASPTSITTIVIVVVIAVDRYAGENIHRP
ncbi:hypothetical protein C8R42DRAFT_659009 [Lentinula raphanica]|nr:hypothetical protein C8R42DRAFT_659009 [Lentinula raphanica]